MRSKWWGRCLTATIALTLVACDDTVKLPGFDERPSEPTIPEPPTEPVTPVGNDGETEPTDSTDISGGDAPNTDGETTDTELDGPSGEGETPDDESSAEDDETTDDSDTGEDAEDEGRGDVTDPPPPPPEPTFSYYKPGDLIPGSGRGSLSETIFAPDMIFPVQTDPAIPQSQVFRAGGGLGPAGGDQCDPENYEVIWRDNFCESRSRFSTPYCPGGEGVHLGQDIRIGTAADCQQLRRLSPRERNLHKIVAVEDGEITNIGSYTVTLKSGGRIYRYLHLNMLTLQISEGQEVSAGDHIGYMSNDFGGTPTTFHLHFEIKVNDAEHGWVFAPPYTSLLSAYAKREGNSGSEVESVIGTASVQPVIIPEGYEIIE